MNALRAASLLLLAAACATAMSRPAVTLHLTQLTSGTFAFAGPVNVQYELSMTNDSSEALTLTQLQVQTVSSGAYTIRPTTVPLNVQLGPGESRTVPIEVWATATGGHLAPYEPVTLRAAANLSGPKSGSFVRLFTENLRQR